MSDRAARRREDRGRRGLPDRFRVEFDTLWQSREDRGHLSSWKCDCGNDCRISAMFGWSTDDLFVFQSSVADVLSAGSVAFQEYVVERADKPADHLDELAIIMLAEALADCRIGLDHFAKLLPLVREAISKKGVERA